MLTDACFKFALESLKKCIVMKPKTSVFFSPHLLYNNLLVAYFGCADDFEDVFRKILHIPDYVSKAILEQYYSDGGGVGQFCYIENGSNDSYTCRIYCRIMISEKKNVFVETLNLFSAAHQVKILDFDIYHPDQIRSFINNSIKCTTQHCIRNLLPPDSINFDTEVVMFNTIYCKGQLDGSFDFDMTNRKKTTKGIINKLKEIKYKSDQLDIHIIEVPCKEKKISTFFIFPSQHLNSKQNNLTDSERIIKLIEQLTTEKGSQELRQLLNDGLLQETDMEFPTFKFEHDLRIYELLEVLGLPDFTPSLPVAEMDEFSRESLRLGDTMHRVSIDLTMNDITAAASNVFFTYSGCTFVRKIFNSRDAISPCICLIYDRSHNSILFCGNLMNS